MKSSLILLLALSSLFLPQCRDQEGQGESSQSGGGESKGQTAVNDMTNLNEDQGASASENPKVDYGALSDEEWKARLTPEQYDILRQAGTEPPNGEVYKEFKGQGGGTYHCAGCNTELFKSDTKFDSHCGWPSFYDPSKAQNVKTDVDFHLGYARTEVRCAVCDGHLGHVFSGERFASMGGGQTPTGQRYCINGTVLKFVPNEQKSGVE